MSITRILKKGIQGASAGTAFGKIVEGALITLGAGTAIVAIAPVSIPEVIATTSVSVASTTACCTLIGGGAGIVSGTIDEIKGR